MVNLREYWMVSLVEQQAVIQQARWLELEVCVRESGTPVLCSLCPEWDERYPVGCDFFGEPCRINGVPCCSVCYGVYLLTHEGEVE